MKRERADHTVYSRCNSDAGDFSTSVDTSTICTQSESIQLSLPESIDDTISIDGISIALDKCTNAGYRLLHAQLLEWKGRVQQLSYEKDDSLRALRQLDIGTNLKDKYKNIKEIPEAKRTLFHHITVSFYEKLAILQNDFQVALQKSKNAKEIAEQQKEKASNIQILCDQNISNLKSTLDAANERKSELERKCKDLQDTVLDIQEKGRKYEYLNSQNQNLKDENIHLRTVVEQNMKDVENIKVENTKLKVRVNDLERKKQELQMDTSFMEKEKSILTQRAETSESQNKMSESALLQATKKCDELTIQVREAKTAAKAESDAKGAIEIQCIRKEKEDELKRYRTHVEVSFKREVSMLKEGKDEVAQQYIDAKNQIKKLQESLDSVKIQKDMSIQRLERSLCDCRSDVKVKCMETSRLQLVVAKLEESTKVLRSEAQMLSDQVEVHRNEFKALEQESLFQRKQLMDEIERKESQLEIYYQSQVHSSTNNENKSLEAWSPQNKQMHFLEKAKQLEKRNLDLQKIITQLKTELKTKVEETKICQSKLNNAEFEIQSILKESKSNEEKVAVEYDTSNHLMSQNQNFKEDLKQARNERDRLSKEYFFLLEKYHLLIGQNVEIVPTNPRIKKSNIQVWSFDALTKKATPTKTSNTWDSMTRMHTSYQGCR